MAGKKPNPAEFAVDFGTVSFRKKVASVAIVVGRDAMTVEQAEDMLVNAQLEVDLVGTQDADEDPNQQGIFEDSDHTMHAVCEVASYTAKSEGFSATLSMPRSSVDPMQFIEFAQRPGRMVVSKLGPAPEKKRGRPRKDAGDNGDVEDDLEDDD